MPRKILLFLLGTLIAASSLAPAAQARDLVRAAAMVAQADEPPPTRSEKLAQQQREADARAQAEGQKKETVEAPYYKKWWFWALTAAVVGGTVALGIWAVEPSAVPARACNPGVIGCFGDGRSGIR
jgi:hypothetical protein